ncbi:hypothetical protein M758_7G155000 [Ceratodon purpureus]|nr:hypothetical protein M758_7G155000 [Ceratodon purpureus]
MAVVKEKQESVRETTAKKEETFIKSFRNDIVIEIEEFKERQAVHPSQDRHGTMEPGPLKTRPPGMAEENKQYMIRKACENACVDANDEKYKHDSYSEHDMCADEARRRGSHFRDLLIRPVHLSELEQNRKWARSTLYGGALDVGAGARLEPENSHTGKFSQERTKSFMDRRKTSVSFSEGVHRKSSANAVAFNRQSIMTQRRGKNMVQIDQEQSIQARRESRMDAMGTCTYVKVRHILSDKQGVMADVYNQLQKGWLAFGNKVPPKDFGKMKWLTSCLSIYMHSLQRSFQCVRRQSMEAIWDGLLVLKLVHQGLSKRLHSPLLLALAALSSNLRKSLCQLPPIVE